jgi:LmbE family N-acetylglucosaminyl deacetylase
MPDDLVHHPDGPVLVVTAHPDDVDFGMAGTLSRWAAGGAEVVYCLVTSGDAGGFDPTISRQGMVEIREREQRDAAAVVGAKDVLFLGYPDGRVQPTIELRRDISRVIRQVRPVRVVTQSPVRDLDRLFASHPDHLAVGEATLCAVYPDARNPFAHPELAEAGFEAHTVAEVWIAGGPAANAWVDITDTFEQKLAALRCHRSQVAHHDPSGFTDMMRSWGVRLAGTGGLPEGRLAEAFRRIDTA